MSVNSGPPFSSTKRRSAASHISRAKLCAPAELSETMHRMGHEVSNPLTATISLATILERSALSREGLAPEKMQSYATSIVDEAWRVSAIIEKTVWILTYGSDIVSPCDPGEAIDAAVQRLQSRFKHNFEVRIHLDPSYPLLAVNPEQFQFVMSELITNSIRALMLLPVDSERTSIDITVGWTENRMTIDITNPVAALYERDLCDLFEPFVVGWPTKVPFGKCTGLGLTTVATIIERFGGELIIEEDQSHGEPVFRVSVELPTHREERPSRPVAEAGALPPSEVPIWPVGTDRELRVLIIDDEEIVGSAIQKILEHELRAAGSIEYVRADGEESLKRFHDGEQFDVVLCDLHLTGMSGRHVLSTLERVSPKSARALIFVTGDRLSREVERYLESTGRPYLLKPFEPQQLLRAIDLVLSAQ